MLAPASEADHAETALPGLARALVHSAEVERFESPKEKEARLRRDAAVAAAMADAEEAWRELQRQEQRRAEDEDLQKVAECPLLKATTDVPEDLAMPDCDQTDAATEAFGAAQADAVSCSAVVEARTGARAKLDEFLAANGFSSVNSKRRRLMCACYPLHVAVARNDPEMVRMLLQAGADATRTDSFRRTPWQVARRKNRRGSHEQVLAALRVAPEAL
mmetsp:Transcript_19341/g.53105  ORF Transcript_19341/g.53105 Transcript_19341/m.53105 type:complete len:218 (-) Transcript_19341:77-730(-)